MDFVVFMVVVCFELFQYHVNGLMVVREFGWLPIGPLEDMLNSTRT